MKKRLVVFGAAAGCIVASAASAIEDVKISGFLTAGATYASDQVLPSSTPNPAGPPDPNDRAVSQDGNIENSVGFTNDTRLGLQVSARVNPKIDVTGQLLAKTSVDNGDINAEWAFMTYKASDAFHIRAGKIKFPTFLISDYFEVGYAYPWVRPPQEVYSSNPIATLNGVDALIRFNVGDSTLLFQPFYGESSGAQALVPQEMVTMFPLCSTLMGAVPPIPVGVTPCPAGTIQYADFTADSLTGVNVSLGSDIYTVRAGYLRTDVSAPAFGSYNDNVEFSSIGATLDWHNIVVYTEYFEREIAGVANLAFPNQKGYYATLGYRFGNFLPHVTVASIDDNDNPTVGPGPGFPPPTPLKQESMTLGFRYELGAGAALKFEAQKVEPEAGTRGLLINDPALGPDANDSVTIYSVAVDVVF